MKQLLFVCTSFFAAILLSCAKPLYIKPEQEPTGLNDSEAKQIIRESLKNISRASVLKDVKFLPNGFKATFDGTQVVETYTCFYKYSQGKKIEAKMHPMADSYLVEGDIEAGNYTQACKQMWKDPQATIRFASAWRHLQASALRRTALGQSDADELAKFKTEVAAPYRSSPAKPLMSEEARRYRVLAEAAFERKQFERSVSYYENALAIAPWWPEGHYNRALLLGELGEYADAVSEMKKFLTLVPEGKEARQAQDKIYVWEAER